MFTQKWLWGIGMLILVLVFATPSFAMVHGAGNLVCYKCHTMHDSIDGADVGAVGPKANLLRDVGTDLCLSCHDGSWNGGEPNVYNIGADEVTPGGDFYRVRSAGGDSGLGHNPVGTAIAVDGTLATAPGGTFASAGLACTSCHDAHATDSTKFFTYRNLLKTVNAADVSTTVGSADAQEADVYDEGTNTNNAITNTNKNVYRTGAAQFGAWCGACHGTFHGDAADADIFTGGKWIRHPTHTNLTAAMVTNYNTVNTNYIYTYPVIDGAGTLTVAGTRAVAATDKVFCLSCHNAHTSANANALKWNYVDQSIASDTACNMCHDK